MVDETRQKSPHLFTNTCLLHISFSTPLDLFSFCFVCCFFRFSVFMYMCSFNQLDL